MAFDRLAADDPAALDLLTLVAWCGPEPVPLTLLTDHPDVLPEPLRPTAADPLALARAAPRSCTGGAWPVYPAQRAAAPGPGRAAARPQPRPGRHGGRVGGDRGPAAATRRCPQDVWNNPAVWPRWQQLLPHVLAAVDPDRPLDDVPDEVSWLLDRAASYRQTRGEPRAALPLFERAYACTVRRAGRRPPRHPRLGQQPRRATCARWVSTSGPAPWTRTP